ncbi:hypothetical protein PGT21_000813 [Puccinia graminis f. sp. tritici]|uniref:Tet-like 2OG-Fe(II) oxygenase domain-containing protein n=1 Tax=Puccinia graminis f. sp. tritici TaxID=56615 RepID=A0A5B0P313_PUCGR|nr:hypothetical protein PGT21_000636 [Puccinia graminis f. sp. tritici]KAA1095553.1 hypothetical protein PGT21_000813 [Puccinia graminis f. sp. tritici]
MDVRRQLDERERARNKWKRKKVRTKKPKSPPILPRNPTTSEIEHAASVVNRDFKLYDHGHVRVFDKAKKNKLIADINFTDIKKMRKRELMDLKFLCSYLNEAKLFVNPVHSKGRSCGGVMWAIGWRKSMKRYEIIGRYKNKKNIEKYNTIYRRHISQQKRAGQILWYLFHKVGDAALENNRQYMRENNLPGWADNDFHEENDSHHAFASNLTFTSHGFFNHAHKDEGDDSELPFAFLLCVPTFRGTGELAFKTYGYDVRGGHFIFRDYGFGVQFKPDMICQMIFSQRDYIHGTLQPIESSKFTKLGMSLQISKKITNICKRIKAREFDEFPSMYYVALNSSYLRL